MNVEDFEILERTLSEASYYCDIAKAKAGAYTRELSEPESIVLADEAIDAIGKSKMYMGRAEEILRAYRPKL